MLAVGTKEVKWEVQSCYKSDTMEEVGGTQWKLPYQDLHIKETSLLRALRAVLSVAYYLTSDLCAKDKPSGPKCSRFHCTSWETKMTLYRSPLAIVTVAVAERGELGGGGAIKV